MFQQIHTLLALVSMGSDRSGTIESDIPTEQNRSMPSNQTSTLDRSQIRLIERNITHCWIVHPAEKFQLILVAGLVRSEVPAVSESRSLRTWLYRATRVQSGTFAFDPMITELEAMIIAHVNLAFDA